MASPVETLMREQLAERREKLEIAGSAGPGDDRIRSLLREVDAALERLEKGTFGICETCHESIEPDRLMADPLCTDGVSEARSAADEEYGIGRLSRLLAGGPARNPAETVNACLGDLQASLAGAPKADDLTLMAIQRVE